MRILLKMLLIFLVTTSSYATVEFLVRLKVDWREAVDRTGWSKRRLDSYKVRYVPGSILLVKPERSPWGSRERPPRLVVIRVTGMSMRDALAYVEPLQDATKPGRPVKRNAKYKISPTMLNQAVLQPGGLLTVTKQEFLDDVTAEVLTIS